MSVSTVISFVDRIESLPPLPTVVHRVLLMTNQNEASLADIAEVVSEDQAIAAKILRIANSSFFGIGRRVTQVSRAISLLGTVGLRNLILGIATRNALAAASSPNVDHVTLWRHSIAVGSACEVIARQVGYKPTEEAFVAGLLHDIGQLAMMSIQPKGLEAVMREQGRSMRFLDLERSQYGIDHTAAGFSILKRWRLPENLCLAALKHHEQQLAHDEPQRQLIAMVMLGDTLAQMMGMGLDIPVGRRERADFASEVLKLDESARIRILANLNQRVEQALEMFSGLDAVHTRMESLALKRVMWISPPDVSHDSMSQMLLEQLGFDVICTSPDAAADSLSPADLIIVALPDEDASADLALSLIEQGRHGVIVLADPPEGAVLRQRDETTGLCSIPRFFTIFDIQWAQSQAAK
jgi:putative nucleotidyltransferase with HDIG domain